MIELGWLTIAKLLKIGRIPVRIAVRHPEWVRYVRQCRNSGDASPDRKERTRTHPDLCENVAI
jgi:hypothetical protein